MTLPSGKKMSVPYGTRVIEIFRNDEFRSLEYPIVGAMVNNEVASLTFKVEVNASIEPVTLDTIEGARIYRRSRRTHGWEQRLIVRHEWRQRKLLSPK